MSSAAIETTNMVKRFGDFTAVNNVSLEIKQGEIFGLLGPNGAGKTTTLSMLCTLSTPTSGQATVNGFDVVSKQDSVRKSIGIVFQDPSVDIELTARENLELHGRLYGMPLNKLNERIDYILKLVELDLKADLPLKTFSGGMKRRLEIGRGLLHFPKILFLDEPTIGLDPQTRRKLLEYVRHISQTEHLTIILTTHYMEEAEFLCNRIGIMDHGKIIALGSAEELKDIFGGDVITLETRETGRLKSVLEMEGTVKEIKVFDSHLNAVVQNGSKALPLIIQAAAKAQVHVDSVSLKRPSLEDVFIHYTGHSLREEESSGKDHARHEARVRGMR